MLIKIEKLFKYNLLITCLLGNSGSSMYLINLKMRLSVIEFMNNLLK